MERLHTSSLNQIYREWQVLREFATLIRDRPKFIPMVLAMYGASFVDPKRAAVFRASYAVARYIDDVVDGDRVSNNPFELIEKYQDIAKTGVIDGGASDPIARLLLFSLEELENIASDTDDVRGDFIRLTNAIVLDHQRSVERRRFTQGELDQYYQDTFTPALNLSLLCAGSRWRAGDVPEMIHGQGILYSIRDLQTDWPRGIYNIPRDVTDSAGLDGENNLDTILSTPEVRIWIDNQRVLGKQYVLALKQNLRDNGDRGAKLVCTPPVRELERITR